MENERRCEGCFVLMGSAEKGYPKPNSPYHNRSCYEHKLDHDHSEDLKIMRRNARIEFREECLN